MKNIVSFQIIVATLITTSFSSCLVIKNYEKPSVKTDNLFRTDQVTDNASTKQDSSSLGEVSWENLFTDKLLSGYIQTALDNNIDIRIALQNINAAEAYLKQGKASFEPSLNLDAGYNYSTTSFNSPQRGIQGGVFQLGGNLSWEADIWGKIRSQKKAFVAGYLQSVEAHKGVKTRLVASVASVYYQLVALSEQMQITKETITTRDSGLITTRALKAAGQVTEVAVQQSQAQVYDAQLILLNLQKQERVLENTLCLLLNQSPQAIQHNLLQQQDIQTSLSTGVPAKLLANRADVMQAEYGLVQAFELTNVAKTNFYPSFILNAGTGLQSALFSDWFSSNSLFSNLGGGLFQPLLNRRQIRTAYEVAKTQQEKALLNYQYTLLTAGADVSNALYDYQTQTQAIEIGEKQYDAYRKAANYSEQLLINGLANYLEVLTARQSALSSQLNLVNLRYARLNAIVSLYEALGGGWR